MTSPQLPEVGPKKKEGGGDFLGTDDVFEGGRRGERYHRRVTEESADLRHCRSAGRKMESADDPSVFGGSSMRERSRRIQDPFGS